MWCCWDHGPSAPCSQNSSLYPSHLEEIHQILRIYNRRTWSPDLCQICRGNTKALTSGIQSPWSPFNHKTCSFTLWRHDEAHHTTFVLQEWALGIIAHSSHQLHRCRTLASSDFHDIQILHSLLAAQVTPPVGFDQLRFPFSQTVTLENNQTGRITRISPVDERHPRFLPWLLLPE
jgi:hypothetical protein